MNNTTLIIVNYLIRGIFVAIGLIIISGNLFPASVDKFTLNFIGGIFVFWGIYRIIIFRMKLKKYKIQLEEDEENESNNN